MATRNRTPNMDRSVTHSQGGYSVQVYRGYLIQPAMMGDVFFVQRDGFTIASCPTVAAARDAIDSVAV